MSANNKNSIKIIGENTDNYVQGYFVYDSKKSGAMTTSHLRFGEKPIRSTYLIKETDFVACHKHTFLDKFDMLKYAREGATFLVNAPWPKDQVWNFLPYEVQEQIIKKGLKFYCIDAYKVARESGVGDRINTVMQACFFEISNILDRETAILQIKEAINKIYGKKGREIAESNYRAVDNALAHLFNVEVPGTDSGSGCGETFYFTAFANTAKMLQEQAQMVVLFNRFYQPDINFENLEVWPAWN